VSRARYATARAVGTAAGRLSRLTGRGSGTTVGGRITLLLDPDALGRAAAGRDLALVSGTNGKTTTRSLLVAALGTLGPVLSNAGGANLPTGLTAALAADRRSPRGVLEVDEPFLPRVVAAVSPRAAVLLNLSRDQLDRYAEVKRLAGIWREALAGPGSQRLKVVANADDPLVAWAARDRSDVVWVAAGQRWTMDSTACPVCGEVLDRTDRSWRCRSCGFGRPRPAWVVDGRRVQAPDGTAYDVDLALPGAVNVGNAALAAAAAGIWQVHPAAAFDAMREISSVEGRYTERVVSDCRVRLLLAKNPAGWSEALEMARPEAPVVVAVNARAADGRDPSWLWDVPFEGLAGRWAVATGDRSRDVAVRLRYAGVDHERIDDPLAAVRAVAGIAARNGTGRAEALANYTAFQDLRRALDRQGGDRG
jgi:UDP-N-acetylmuramyl tripeptide synthase